jgi:type IV pilus biogenesis protein PilP
MLDKKQLVGAGVAIVVLFGVSVATGKIDINNLTGKAEPEVNFGRKLPPPVTDGGEVLATAEDASAVVDAALLNTESGSSNDPFLAELTGTPIETVPADPEAVTPAATIASINPQSAVDAVFAKTPLITAEELISNTAPVDTAPQTAPMPAVPSRALPSPSLSTTAVTHAFEAGLPENATGQDLLRLQSQLAVIEKQKALAEGEEAIAESRLKAAIAQYEMSQIGRPTADERAAAMKAKEEETKLRSVSVTPGVNASALDAIRVLSTSRANGTTFATILFNGKLVDVKKGTFVHGYLVDQVSDNHVKFVGETESKTVWIN